VGTWNVIDHIAKLDMYYRLILSSNSMLYIYSRTKKIIQFP